MRLIIAFLLLFLWFNVDAQSGGNSTYNFLRLSPSARITALGSAATATLDADVNLAFYNPALYSQNIGNRLGLSLVNYIGDISHGQVSYALPKETKYGFFGGGVQYVNYGEFVRRDAAGVEQGTFRAGELALQAGWGYAFAHNLRVGANFKLIGSYLESYNSHGFAIDLSGMYVDTSRNLVVAVLFRNFGAQFDTYVPGIRETLPFDVQLAITNRLKYVPLRWGVIFHSLNRWDLAYNDPNDQYYRPQLLLSSGEVAPAPETTFTDEFFRHLIFNTELLLSKNFHLRLGYNHMRRKELTIPTRNGSSGFSFGFGMQVKKFRFDYGRGAVSLAGMTNSLSITTNLSDF